MKTTETALCVLYSTLRSRKEVVRMMGLSALVTIQGYHRRHTCERSGQAKCKHLGGSVGDLLEVLSRHLSGGTEESHETTSQYGSFPCRIGIRKLPLRQIIRWELLQLGEGEVLNNLTLSWEEQCMLG
jgi:hypothetical protein